MKEINWKKVDVGTWFTAIIHNHKVIGKVTGFDNYVYLCQDIIDTGRSPLVDPLRLISPLGFKFTLCVGKGTIVELMRYYSVFNLKLHKRKPTGYKPSRKLDFKINGYEVWITDKNVVVGCTKVSYKEVLEIFNELKK